MASRPAPPHVPAPLACVLHPTGLSPLRLSLSPSRPLSSSLPLPARRPAPVAALCLFPRHHPAGAAYPRSPRRRAPLPSPPSALACCSPPVCLLCPASSVAAAPPPRRQAPPVASSSAARAHRRQRIFSASALLFPHKTPAPPTLLPPSFVAGHLFCLQPAGPASPSQPLAVAAAVLPLLCDETPRCCMCCCHTWSAPWRPTSSRTSKPVP